MRIIKLTIPLILLAACSRENAFNTPPDFTPKAQSTEEMVLSSYDLGVALPPENAAPAASLWSGARGSLLGERRAMQRGDILTVVIEINDRAEMSNTSAQNRNSEQSASINALFGLPEQLNGTSLSPALELDSQNSFKGTGSVKRNERLTLRVAATIISTHRNGIMEISGTQEVRVNNELRELTVTGFVRPNDISRQNEIQYDRIASARISYGGRGQVSSVQRPKIGQQIIEKISPF